MKETELSNEMRAADSLFTSEAGSVTSASAATPAALAVPAAPASPAWDAGLEDSYRSALASKGWKSPNDMAKSYLELERKVGAKGVIVPGKDASAEDVASFRKALGVPVAADKYELDLPPDSYDARRVAMALPIFHKAGVPNAMAKELVQAVGAAERAELGRLVAERRAAEQRDVDVLKAQWGAAYESKTAGMRQAAVRVGFLSETDLGKLEQSIGTAQMFRFLDHVFARIGDDEVVGTGARGSFGTTAEGAADELRRMKADPGTSKALSDRRHPDHQDTVARWNRLIEARDGLRGPA